MSHKHFNPVTFRSHLIVQNCPQFCLLTASQLTCQTLENIKHFLHFVRVHLICDCSSSFCCLKNATKDSIPTNWHHITSWNSRMHSNELTGRYFVHEMSVKHTQAELFTKHTDTQYHCTSLSRSTFVHQLYYLQQPHALVQDKPVTAKKWWDLSFQAKVRISSSFGVWQVFQTEWGMDSFKSKVQHFNHFHTSVNYLLQMNTMYSH